MASAALPGYGQAEGSRVGEASERDSMFGLTPEHLERIKRIAAARKQTPEQVLADAVMEYWVRYATRERLAPKEW